MDPISARSVAAWAAHLGADPAELDGEALRRTLAAGTLPAAFATAATAHPRATVSIDGERRTLAGIHLQSAGAASVLAESGAARGSRVVISAGTSWPLVIGYLAALRTGATVILANPDYTGTELQAIVERAAAALLLADDSSRGAVGTPTLRLADLVARASDAPAHPPVDLSADDVALLAFTSGTTGRPKGVPLTHANLLASIRSVMWAWRWSESDTLVHSLPLFHQHGLGGLHATLLAGSHAALLSRFDPHELVATVERERGTVVFGVPSIHERLVALDREQLAPLRRLRLVTSGSAALAPAVAADLRARTGLEPLERYGLTESGLDVSNLYAGERVVGTVGVPLPGIEAALLDPQGAPVADGTDGEIALRGPQVFSGYLDDPTATAEAFWPGGWFRTGDLGRWDADGRLVITGRLKELIITGGMNVTPGEVEVVIERFPGVREAAVAGTPSERWGEAVTAWVVPEPGATVDPTEVIAFCRERLAAYKCPKDVSLTSALPRNAMGKIVRTELTAPGDGRPNDGQPSDGHG